MEKFFYRVRENETVFSVSEKFSVPPLLIIKDNALFRDIEKGDVLFIRKVGKIYSVGVSDTFNSISEKFGVPAFTIQEFNNLPFLFYGLKIVIPDVF